MNQITFNLIIGSLIRAGVMAAAGWLAAHGMLPSGSVEDWVGAVVLTVLAVLWSLYQKYIERIKLGTAMQMPPGTTESKVVEKIAAGEGATLAEVK